MSNIKDRVFTDEQFTDALHTVARLLLDTSSPCWPTRLRRTGKTERASRIELGRPL